MPVNQTSKNEVKYQLNKIQEDGLNIFAILNRTKKELKNTKLYIPDDVLLKVCDQYWFEKKTIKRAFPWFIKVLKMEWMAYNARRNIHEHQAVKESSGEFRGELEALDDILKRVMGKIEHEKDPGV